MKAKRNLINFLTTLKVQLDALDVGMFRKNFAPANAPPNNKYFHFTHFRIITSSVRANRCTLSATIGENCATGVKKEKKET